MEKQKDIELRSEKVRNIIGQIPPFLVRSGMGVIALVVALALVVCYFIPYYETVSGRIELFSDPAGEICLSPEDGVVHFHVSGPNVAQGDVVGSLQTADTLIQFHSRQSGRLTLNTRQGSRVSAGEPIFAITQDSISSIYGQLLIPQEHASKVKQGQSVKIELDGHPSNEYGVLQGAVARIYPLPIDTRPSRQCSEPITAGRTDKQQIDNSGKRFIKADIDLPNPLTSTAGKTIMFSPEMRGNASIVISKQRLIMKLLTTK